jgi:hypothetical protein
MTSDISRWWTTQHYVRNYCMNQQQPYARFLSIYTNIRQARKLYHSKHLATMFHQFTMLLMIMLTTLHVSPWMLMICPPNRPDAESPDRDQTNKHFILRNQTSSLPQLRIELTKIDPVWPSATLSLTAIQECLACTCVCVHFLERTFGS